MGESFLKEGITPRLYQSAIAESALSKGNTLVVLPTGLGKTLIAFLLIEKKMREGRVAFLAPTKPLVQQHYRTFLSMTNVPESEVSLITGEISPKKRVDAWNRKVCFSTPQSLQNDMKNGRAGEKFSLCVIDEAHRAVGKYAYTFVARQCAKSGALILGLTASPGGSKKHIAEIVEALGAQNIEIRTAYDSDVAPYVKPLEMNFIKVPLGESFSGIRDLLAEMLKDYANHLAKYGFVAPLKSKTGLVALHAKIMRAPDNVKYRAISLYSTVFNLVHMLELIETQGLATFLSYVQKLREKEPTKARARIFADKRFAQALEICQTAAEHPKMAELLKLLEGHRGEKTLVFAQYRDQVKTIVETIRQDGFSAERFVGKKEGVTSDEQKETIGKFSRGEFDVMVATSIGEEGLDIPSVDNVIFFEPTASEIRTIQRRGRAGRFKLGRVFVLITTATRDEAYFHSSRKKEENMRRIVGKMQVDFSRKNAIGKKQPGIADGAEVISAGNAPAESAGKRNAEEQAEKRADDGRERKARAKRKSAPTQSKITDFE